MGGDAGGSWRWIELRFPGGGQGRSRRSRSEYGFLSRFLERYGEGLHHITFKTDNIREAIEDLEGRGYELVEAPTSTTRTGRRPSCGRRWLMEP